MRPQSTYNRLPVISPGEKIVSAATYLTTGLVGFIWIIISNVSGSKIKPFLKFHIFQSIFLSILFYVGNLILKILVLGIAVKIPFIGSFIFLIYSSVFFKQIFFGYSIIDIFVFTIIIYLVIASFRGKEGTLPQISKIVKEMM